MRRTKSSNVLMLDRSHLKQKSGIENSIRGRAAVTNDRMVAILKEAEDLFAKGEYESALVKFSRGAALRPNDESFSNGIKKSQMAIMNDLKGTGEPVQMLKKQLQTPQRSLDKLGRDSQKAETDRSYFGSDTKSITLRKAYAKLKKAQEERNEADNEEAEPYEGLKTSFVKIKDKQAEAIYKLTVHDGEAYKIVTATAQDVKEYLKDKDYFKMKEKTAKEWKKLRREMNKRLAEKEAAERFESAAKVLEEASKVKHHCEEQILLIVHHYQNGRFGDVIRFSENFMKYLNNKPDKTLPKKWLYIATCYSYLGKAYCDEGDFEKAKCYAEKLYKVAVNGSNKELLIQSYILSGKIFVRFRNFERAAAIWEKLIPIVEQPEKKAWLYHEIGRCFFELGKYDESRIYGMQSVAYADKCFSSNWLCTSNMFLGQVEMKRGKLKVALERFVEAHKYADEGKDEKKEEYIKSVIEVLKTALSQWKVQ